MKNLYRTAFEQVLSQLGSDPARVAEQRAALASRCSATEKEAHPMRIKKVTQTVLIAAAVAAVLSVGALAASGAIHIPFLTTGGITQGVDEDGNHYSAVSMDTSGTPLEVRDGRLYLTAEDGQELDLTGQFSEETAYVYSYQTADGYVHDIIIGGTVEDYGCMEFVYDADGNFTGGSGSFPSAYSSTNEPEWLIAYQQAHGLPTFGGAADSEDGAESVSGSDGSFGNGQPIWLEKGITVENGQVLLAVNSETLDITGQFSQEQAYVYTAPDTDENGFHHIILVGGTSEEPKTAEYAYQDGGGWHMSMGVHPEDAPWLETWMTEQGLR